MRVSEWTKKNMCGVTVLVGNEMDRNRQNHGQEHGATSDDHWAVAKVLVARAAVFDAYVRRGVYGARAIVAPAVRRPSAWPDYQQLAVHSLFLFLAHGLQESRMRCSATVLDCTFGHVHRVVATLVRVRGAHPTVDRCAVVR